MKPPPRKPRRSPPPLATGLRLIERAISPDGTPVTGLYLFTAYGRLVRTIGRDTRFAAISPVTIGVPALLRAHPGLSQTELAELMGVERMTAGLHVKQCIRDGLVTRRRSPTDRRKYELQVTARGVANLKRVARLIPLHEQLLFGHMTRREQATLHRLLARFIDGAPPPRP